MAYQYPNIFYLPESTEFGFKESIIRFDKAFAINGQLLKSKPISLSDDALFCLMNWFNCLLEQGLDEIIRQYIEAAQEKL